MRVDAECFVLRIDLDIASLGERDGAMGAHTAGGDLARLVAEDEALR